jgi:hypothetical protein
LNVFAAGPAGGVDQYFHHGDKILVLQKPLLGKLVLEKCLRLPGEGGNCPPDLRVGRSALSLGS